MPKIVGAIPRFVEGSDLTCAEWHANAMQSAAPPNEWKWTISCKEAVLVP